METTTEATYYTPSIEEFHVGFEFQALGSRDWYIGEGAIGWTDMQFHFRLFPYGSIETVNDALRKEWIRVKHLDSKDIEAEGWFKRTSVDDEWRFGEFQEYYMHQAKNEKYRIVAVGENGWDDEEILFYGTIRNRSELKTIMRQIGVK